MAHALLVPGLIALGVTAFAVKKGWIGNPIDKVKSLIKTGQLGSASDLAEGQAAIEADLQRYQQYPGSAPGWGWGGGPYGYGYAQQSPFFGQSAYPMQNPYYGQPWFSQPGMLPQGGMTHQWHTPGAS